MVTRMSGFWQGVLYLALVAAVIGLTIVHLQRPKLHMLQAAILLASLAVVWLGVELAT